MSESLDVLIIGAGLSGVGAAHHLATRLPGKSFAILEGRERLGGTWDLFRYPGIRSDSDMYTLGYAFRPWSEAKAIADGPSILSYVKATAAENGIAERIRYQHKVTALAWSSAEALWTATVETPDGVQALKARFVMSCTGYFDYAGGYTPEIAGLESFTGAVVHPQAWPETLDYAGKRVVVIGSGATAVTLVPAMTDKAAHVTMLQRSPTYVVSRPAEDAMANWLRRKLSPKLAYRVIRWRNVLLGMFFFQRMRKYPDRAKAQLIAMARKELKPGYDVETHFTPRYNPWDQRLCLVPDSDLFKALNDERASVVTGEIETVTPTGITLKSGETLDADVVVTATGLRLQPLAGMAISVDGAPVTLGERMNYRGTMIEGVPNLSAVFGYTNASWTLKADLTSAWACRLIAWMDARGYTSATPENHDPDVATEPFLSFSSGYVQRAVALFPKQGTKAPWKLHQNYVLDILTLRHARMDDGVLKFRRAEKSSSAAPPIPRQAEAA